MIGRSLHERLHRIQAHLSQASEQGEIGRTMFLHAVEGRPAGVSVIAPDGRQIWWDPPAGCKAGEAVEEQDGSVPDKAA